MFKVALAIYLAGVSVVDLRKKEFPVWVPLVVAGLSAAAALLAHRQIINMPLVLAAVFMVVMTLVTREQMGWGDVLILIGLLPLCGWQGVLRIALDAQMLLLLVWLFGWRRREVAYVPFLTAGYGLWMILQ